VTPNQPAEDLLDAFTAAVNRQAKAVDRCGGP